ncbi:MAG: (Fe-S)-binding protein [bacterium]
MDDSLIYFLRVGVVVAVFFMFAVAARTVFWLLRYVAMGEGRPQLDRVPERVQGFMTYVLGQRRVIAEPAGVLHLFIFWGFLVLQLETIEYLIRGPFPDFRLSAVLGHSVYDFTLLLQDVFGLLVLTAITIAVVRRFIARPRHVVVSMDALVISACIAGLMVTKFLANGAEIASAGAALGHDPSWTPIARWVSYLFSPDSQFTVIAMHASYAAHLLIVGFFSIYIPTGKHLHLIGAMPNVFFRKLEPRGALSAMDMEAEVESYGAAKVEDLSWKQLLDTYACTECGRCEAYCPAYNTGKALNPMMVIHKIKDHLKDKGVATLRDKTANEETEWPLLAGGIISKEELMACTTCGACVANCPVFIEHVDTIVDMRRYLALMEADFTPEVSRTFRNMENNSNPWGISSSYRGDWADGLEIPMMSELPEPPEYLFWVGCAGSFDDRQKKVTQSFAKILKSAGVSFAILGSEEGCTGDPARRIGNEYLYWMLATQNIETLNGYNVRKIVTTCPHCFHTIGKEYPQLGGKYEVIHHSDFMSQLLKDGRLNLKPSVATRITYHDSCYIGRWNNEYNAPRHVLNSVPGLQVQEMELNKAQSFCCGAGGGRMWMEEHEGKRVNIERTDQALATNPEAIAVACPFCMTMFDDGLKNRGAESIPLRDLAEIIAESLEDDVTSIPAAAE